MKTHVAIIGAGPAGFQGTVDLLEETGAGGRMRDEGIPHTGFAFCFDVDTLRIDLAGLQAGLAQN